MSEAVSPTPPLEVYADAFYVKWSDYGVDLTFGRDWNGETSVLGDARVTVVIGDQLGKELAETLIRIMAERAAARETQDESSKPQPSGPTGPADIGDLT